MRFETRFLATKETRAFLERYHLQDMVKESADGICELKASSITKLQAMIDFAVEKSYLAQIEQRMADLVYGYLESVENGTHVDVSVSVSPFFQGTGIEIKVGLSTEGGNVNDRFSFEVPHESPSKSDRLAKFFPVAHLLCDKESPLFAPEIDRELSSYALGEQVLPLLKRSAEQGKQVRAKAKELLAKYNPSKYSVVDSIVEGEKAAIALIKKSVNVAKPIDFEVSRFQIIQDGLKGYQSVINFTAGGKSAHFALSAVESRRNYNQLSFYSVILKGLATGKVTGYFEDKWITKELPGRSEEEFKNTMTNWGMRTAKGGAEKRFNLVSAALKDYDVSSKDESLIADFSFTKELDEPGRADQFKMPDSIKKKITDLLTEAGALAKKSGLKLGLSLNYEQIDYYDGCNTYYIPHFSVKDNAFKLWEGDSNATPKGWEMNIEARIEIPKQAKIDKLDEISRLIRSAQEAGLNPSGYSQSRSRW